MSILNRAFFLKSAACLKQLPSTGFPEICFIGKSNSGKSTAINSLTNKHSLAFSSKTPGCTKLINLFDLTIKSQNSKNFQGYLVDLPGYGYAKISWKEKNKIEKLINNYLCYRKFIVGIVLLIDIRRGITVLDKKLIKLISSYNRSILILLSKADKVSYNEQTNAIFSIKNSLGNTINIEKIIPFSSKNHIGLKEAIQCITDWFLK
ncbi:MAG: YihA family ribosome biogenesis GTP-binding protein [Bordetella sp.]|nr:MAG: YihA family ribosome biogenesis GTP-binding protein [Bordetella sp.]